MEKTEEDSPLKEVWLQRETGSSWGAVRKGCWLKSLVSSLLGKKRISKSFNDDVSVKTEVEDPGKKG